MKFSFFVYIRGVLNYCITKTKSEIEKQILNTILVNIPKLLKDINNISNTDAESLNSIKSIKNMFSEILIPHHEKKNNNDTISFSDLLLKNVSKLPYVVFFIRAVVKKCKQYVKKYMGEETKNDKLKLSLNSTIASELYNFIINNSISEPSNFQKALFDEFLFLVLPSESELMTFFQRNISQHTKLTIFGSAAFDVDNAHDLDVFGEANERKKFVEDIKLFFHLKSIKKVNNNDFDDSNDNKTELNVDEFIFNQTDNEYENFRSISCSYPVTEFTNITHNYVSCELPADISNIEIKIDLLPKKLFDTFQKKMYIPPFWEMGLLLTRGNMCIRSDLKDRQDCPSIANIIENRIAKVLEPIQILVSSDDDHDNTCDIKCKLFNLSQRLKHVNRYLFKSQIYQIDSIMPFMGNYVPTDMINDNELCYLCGKEMVSIPNSFDNFYVKVVNGTKYIHSMCLMDQINSALCDIRQLDDKKREEKKLAKKKLTEKKRSEKKLAKNKRAEKKLSKKQTEKKIVKKRGSKKNSKAQDDESQDDESHEDSQNDDIQHQDEEIQNNDTQNFDYQCNDKLTLIMNTFKCYEDTEL
jgi:hypothetical protein